MEEKYESKRQSPGSVSPLYDEESLAERAQSAKSDIDYDRAQPINRDSDYDSEDTNEINAPLLKLPDSDLNSADQNVGSVNQRNYSFDDSSSKSKVPCPTCQGKGKLSQGQAESVVALIPVRDKRLKPRKTKLYIGATVVFSMVSIFLVAFFLLPRTLSVIVAEYKTVNIKMTDITDPHIDITVTYNVRNENFFAATVKDLFTDIYWNNVILNTTTNMKAFKVPGRHTKQASFTLRQYYQGDASTKVKLLCNTGWKWKLLQKFVSTAIISYLSHTEQITHNDFFWIECYNASQIVRNKRSIGLRL